MHVAVVSGANRGLGLEFVQQLLTRDWRVIAGCRKPDQTRKLTSLAGAHPGRLHVMPLDVASERSITAFVHEAQLVTDRLDLLINNAGLLVSGERLGNLAGKSLSESFAVNASGPLLLSQAFIELLQKSDNARIVNISTVMASLTTTTVFRSASYAMSKAALNMATRLLAAELAPLRIAVTSFHPGWVQTEMGGANAPLTATESVSGLLQRILDMSLADSGRFIDAEGADLPW